MTPKELAAIFESQLPINTKDELLIALHLICERALIATNWNQKQSRLLLLAMLAEIKRGKAAADQEVFDWLATDVFDNILDGAFRAKQETKS